MMDLPTNPADAAARARRVGEKIPDFLLRTPGGEPTRLSSLLASGPVVLVFVRGAWCPFCDKQLQELADRAAAFVEAKAQLVIVAPEAGDVEGGVKSLDLPLTILLDPEQLVAEILGLTYRVNAKLRASLVEKLGVLLPKRCGVARWELPIPSTFVVDPDATVRAAWTSADPAVRPSADDILAALSG
jgi:peroxiredoxin